MSHRMVGNLANLLHMLDSLRPNVAAHSRRVSQLALPVAAQYGASREVLEAVRLGALVHDLGKLAVSSRILSKRAELTPDEWQDLMLHPEIGAELTTNLGLDDLVCQVTLHHHERYDGAGYPDGLKGQAIPWAARIVAVLDTFDALTHERPYREAVSVDVARAIIARHAGSQFCPAVVSIFLSLPSSQLASPSDEISDRLYVPDAHVGELEGLYESWTPRLL